MYDPLLTILNEFPGFVPSKLPPVVFKYMVAPVVVVRFIALLIVILRSVFMMSSCTSIVSPSLIVLFKVSFKNTVL